MYYLYFLFIRIPAQKYGKGHNIFIMCGKFQQRIRNIYILSYGNVCNNLL